MQQDSARNRRKQAIRAHADAFAERRRDWKRRTRYFHDLDAKYMRFLVPEGQKVLDLGCGPGDLLAALEPSAGVGIDFSPKMIEIARDAHPHLQFHLADVENPDEMDAVDGGPFDAIILSDAIGTFEDCQATLENLHRFCHRDTRIIISYYAYGWEPLLRAAERLGLKMPQVEQNSISPADLQHFLHLADFTTVKQERRILSPIGFFGFGRLLNRWISFLPLVRRMTIRSYTVASSARLAPLPEQSVSVSIIIPCRNERGNVEAAIRRLPSFGSSQEIIFIEGHSQDGTFEEIERVAKAYEETHTIRYARQDGIGKGDAMRKGYAMAKGDILMILDGDLTVPPEELPKFYDAIVGGKGDFINGSRLVYPMEDDAMRFLNRIANSVFAWVFSWLLNQRITDTLCGTKVLSRGHYQRIADNRGYFGEFDPFGDFDLIFGASKQNLRIIDMPVRYASRTYGETQISRFRHGWLLLRMVLFAYKKLAAI